MTTADGQPGIAPRSLRDRTKSAGKRGGVEAREASDALLEAVGALDDHAVDRVLLTGERVTSAAEGKRLLAGEAETEARADKVAARCRGRRARRPRTSARCPL